MNEPVDPSESIEILSRCCPPEGFQALMHRDSIEEGEIIEVTIAGETLAIANIQGAFFAVSGMCPHAGGPLADGRLCGAVLSCPFHGWKFDMENGHCLTNPDKPLIQYTVHLEGDVVCVKV